MKKSIKIIFNFCGLFAIMCGLAPVIFSVFNAGSVGLVTFGALLLILIFLWDVFDERDKVKRKLKAVNDHRPSTTPKWWKATRSVTAATLILCAAGGIAISIPMISAIFHSPEKERAYTVIVLGCQIIDDQPSTMLKRRLEAAYDYLSSHSDSSVVTTGGKGIGDNYSEAYVMKKYLIERGISEKRIYMDEKSRTTEENISFAADIIRQNDLPQSIAVASDSFHVMRGTLYAKKNGFTQTATLPAQTPPGLLPSYWIREWFAISKALILD